MESDRNEEHTEAAAENPGGKSGKKRKLLIGILAAVTGIIVLTAVIWYNLPQQRFDRQMSIGKQFLDETEYEDAVLAFTTALEILPDEASATEQLETTYVAWGDSCLSDGDYESAVETLGKGKSQLPDSTAFEDPLAKTYVAWGKSCAESGDYQTAATVLQEGMDATGENSAVRGALIDTYLAWTKSLVESGDLDGAKKVIAEAADVVPSDEVTKEQTEVEDRIREQEVLDAANETVQEITDTASVDDIETATDNILKLLSDHMDDLMQICDNHDGTYVDPGNGFGVYNIDGLYYLYLGEFDGDKRQGHAMWLQFYRDVDGVTGFYRYDGEWENDLPNGSMVATYSTVPNKMVGTVVDGLWDGKVADTMPDRDTGVLSTWIETYDHGKLQILETDRTGDDHPYACAVNADDSGEYLWFMEEEVNSTYGVSGFLPADKTDG